MKVGIIGGLLSIWLVSSCTGNTALQQILEYAGDNRQELEQVLHHYRDDEQKQRAAVFLIENMPGKGSICYSGKWNERQTIEADLYTVTADLLIENIDLAFKVWREYPWCQHLTEAEFFRQILPYRTKNEPLEDWRSFYYHKYKGVADSLAACGASMHEVVFFVNSHYGKKYTHAADSILGDLSYRQMEQIGGGTCDRLALNALQVMRSIGVPLNMDCLPYHGKVNGGHVYNSFTDENGVFHYFSPYEREPERKQWVAPLVRRIIFESPRYEEVTSYYYEVSDVSLSPSVLHLATYNRGALKKIKEGIKEGERSVFRNMSRGLLYFPTDTFNRPVIGIPPFLLGTDGAVRFIPSPDFNHTVSLGKLCLYDVKRKLSLGNERYTLRGWDNGWHDLATAVSTDSVTLDFGEVPDYKLFVIYGETYMGRMQRPFVVAGDSIAYY